MLLGFITLQKYHRHPQIFDIQILHLVERVRRFSTSKAESDVGGRGGNKES